MEPQVIMKNGEVPTPEEKAHAAGSPRSSKGAIRFGKKGKKVDAHFFYDAEGNLHEDSYVVVKDSGFIQPLLW